MAATTIEFRIRRQDSQASEPYWENFSIPYQANMNVISCLMEIRANPVTKEGKPTTPVIWDSGCLEEVCGACSMNINGVPRQSCTALVDELEQPIVLEPFSKFPPIRDLWVDRARMFEALKRVRAWVPIDGTYALGEGPKMAEEDRAELYKYSRCMTCGCCLEACPQINENSPFIGAAPLAQVVLFNAHPTGAMHKAPRLDAVMEPGGVSDCGNAQNCVRVCPKEIPLTDAIADLGGQVTMHALRKFFRR
jgi:succinate dehydrogenase / fumarate reductase iron-sulfur subunit